MSCGNSSDGCARDEYLARWHAAEMKLATIIGLTQAVDDMVGLGIEPDYAKIVARLKEIVGQGK